MTDSTLLTGFTTTYQSLSSRHYPLCEEFFCDVYFTPQKVISIGIMLGRLLIAVLILVLGTKMEKDFMRSISNTIFIPIVVSELFAIYIECVNFADFFTKSSKESKEFRSAYILWTQGFLSVMNDYVHINIVCMLPLLLYCGRIATLPGDRINAFPTNMICMVMQVVPFFVSILNYVHTTNAATVLAILAAMSRIVTLVCFSAILVQIFVSIVVLMRDLPYEAATSVDMQVRDARCRLAWTLAYIAIPFITLIPFIVEAIFYVFDIHGKPNSGTRLAKVICDILIVMVHFYRPTWMVIITMVFLPPYRRAVPLLFCCCSFCPKVDVEPLPRKPNDMSLMYRYADI
ncbi:unnamed protein product [Caenorhabditis bovis]|uniref:Uncharacterized protein n=1 Tax=Caenorhabditis bovis TaxID=2654633 RepID=A0A8S1F1D5_9PELO|nr:unnamed protein product [Caenorhabditis bovis]